MKIISHWERHWVSVQWPTSGKLAVTVVNCGVFDTDYRSKVVHRRLPRSVAPLVHPWTLTRSTSSATSGRQAERSTGASFPSAATDSNDHARTHRLGKYHQYLRRWISASRDLIAIALFPTKIGLGVDRHHAHLEIE